jgi:hypothetical protein
MNYPCQKATATFKGRNYEAWFTQSIPFSDGPYKFSGLPGLILEIRDTQGHYVFQCVGIKKLQPLQPIKFWKWPYIKTTREKLLDYLKKMHQNPIEYFKSNGQTLGTIENGKNVDNPKDFVWPYNPIELE